MNFTPDGAEIKALTKYLFKPKALHILSDAVFTSMVIILQDFKILEEEIGKVFFYCVSW